MSGIGLIIIRIFKTFRVVGCGLKTIIIRISDVTRQMPGSSARVTTQGSSLTNNYDARKCNDENLRNNEKHRERQLT